MTAYILPYINIREYDNVVCYIYYFLDKINNKGRKI
jgi:hypothetical protein